MSDNTMNREELTHLADEEIEKRENQPAPYVERPKSHRVMAWILTGLIVAGVLLYYAWIAGILH